MWMGPGFILARGHPGQHVLLRRTGEVHREGGERVGSRLPSWHLLEGTLFSTSILVRASFILSSEWGTEKEEQLMKCLWLSESINQDLLKWVVSPNPSCPPTSHVSLCYYELCLLIKHFCVGFFTTPTNSPTPWTVTGCPSIQFNPDTKYLELA